MTLLDGWLFAGLLLSMLGLILVFLRVESVMWDSIIKSGSKRG